jgi:hypothetical protein
MKKLIPLVLAALFCVPAFADDAENKASDTVDTSKNPITGTTTTTQKHKRKWKKGADHGSATVTEKTKVKKDGEVDKSVDVKGDSTEK